MALESHLKEESTNGRFISSSSSELDPFFIFLISFFVMWAIRATILYSIDEGLRSDSVRLVYSIFVKILLWVVPTIAYVHFVDKQPVLRYLKLTTKVGRKRIFWGIVAIMLYFSAVIAFEALFLGKRLVLLDGFNSQDWSRALLFLGFSPIAEEIPFRGFFLNKFGERMRFWRANTVTALSFVFIHWPNWLWRDGFQSSMIYTSASVFILAIFLGYLVRMTHSLWPSVVAHIVNNFLASMFQV